MAGERLRDLISMRSLLCSVLVASAAALVGCSTDAGTTPQPDATASTDGASAGDTGAAAAKTAGADARAADAAATDPADTDAAPAMTPDPAAETPVNDADTLYAGTMHDLAGESVDLADFRGKVVMFVNVASECGYTPQYADLQKLQEELGGDAFTIVGVPSNDFGGQEPGSPAEIREFCDSRYGVTFPMMEKVETKGDAAAPLYKKLAAMTGEAPSWNFCKYVVSKDGTQAKFFKSAVKPGSDELRQTIRSFME